MPPEIQALLILYGVGISVTAIGVTMYDKKAAKKYPKNRIRERSLLTLGLLGGALAMDITMLLIHHKTRKKKFMIGLPLMLVLHTALLTFLALQY